MATTQAVVTISRPANADLSASQFRFGAVNTSGRVVLASGSGQRCDGVIGNKPTALGQPTELQVGGVVKVICAAAINPGVEVMTDANGAAIVATSTNNVLGIYQGTSASASGDVISILIVKYVKS